MLKYFQNCCLINQNTSGCPRTYSPAASLVALGDFRFFARLPASPQIPYLPLPRRFKTVGSMSAERRCWAQLILGPTRHVTVYGDSHARMTHEAAVTAYAADFVSTIDREIRAITHAFRKILIRIFTDDISHNRHNVRKITKS